MKSPSSMDTMRRGKRIEDAAPEKKAQALAEDQNGSLTDIVSSLSEIQASTDLVSEVVETKGNQVLDGLTGLGNKIEEAGAASELNAEASENTTSEVKKLTDVASVISEKIGKLAEALGVKLDSKPVPGQDTSLAIVEDSLPEPVADPLDELLHNAFPPLVVPPEDRPFDNEEEKPKDDDKKGDKKGLKEKLDELLKATKGGFKSALSVSDRIAGMLFKYTITAAAEAAKLAGMIFALILGIDVIRINFKYWSDMFKSSFSDFYERAKEWGPLIESVITMAEDIKKMFDEKNWSGLVVAIAKGIGNILINVADLIFLGLGKLTAGILRAFGKDDMALTIEGATLEKFQASSGASLDEEDQKTLARYQDKRAQDDYASEKKENERFGGKPAALGTAVQYGSISPETAEKITSGNITRPELELPEEERLKIRMANNEAKAALQRTNELAEKTDAGDSRRIKNLGESMDEIKTRLADPALENSPKERKELQDEYDRLNAKISAIKTPTVAPAPVEESPDSEVSKRITAKQNNREETTRREQAPAPSIISVNKTNKTMINMPPQSSTPAPGMNRTNNVN